MLTILPFIINYLVINWIFASIEPFCNTPFLQKGHENEFHTCKKTVIKRRFHLTIPCSSYIQAIYITQTKPGDSSTNQFLLISHEIFSTSDIGFEFQRIFADNFIRNSDSVDWFSKLCRNILRENMLKMVTGQFWSRIHHPTSFAFEMH